MPKQNISDINFWLLTLFRKTDALIDDVSAFQQYIEDFDTAEHAEKIADAERVWTLLNEVWIVLDKYSTTPSVRD